MTYTPRAAERGGRPPLDRLARIIEALTGRPATAEALGQFGRYLDLLIVWNRSQRLTGALSATAIVEDLFEDSLLFLSKLPGGRLRVADLGAGAGIPGVPLAIVRPEISMTLIEAKRKRVSFLLALTRELGADNIMVFEGRAENLIDRIIESRGQFDAVVSRSVGPIKSLFPIAMAYLARGGLFLAAGAPSPEQLRDLAYLGIRREVVELPEIGRKRAFLLASKSQ